MLENIGYSFKGKNESLKVVKDSLVVIKRGRKNSVYVLKGTSMTSSASMHAGVTCNKIGLWHLRLGHISEKGLKKLSR